MLLLKIERLIVSSVFVCVRKSKKKKIDRLWR